MMLPTISNLFSSASMYTPATDPTGEVFHTLLQTPHIKLEHITSRGQASPPDFWYDQDEEEWVLLLRGEATLEFADSGMLKLTSGDHLTIPRHLRHRVHHTSEDAIWLALFMRV